MHAQTTHIERHYGRGDLLDRILTALDHAGHRGREFSPEILGPIEHLHTGGLAFTRDQAHRIGLDWSMRVLDLGCGIGGPARYLASTYDCDVVGVDVTAEFIDVARSLTEFSGLAGRVSFQCADAVCIPFEDGSFDAVFCQNLSMNVEDKARLFAEARRVLRPGGRFSSADHTQGPGGRPYYPTGWAGSDQDSFLVTPSEMRRLLEHSGFRILEWRDHSSDVLTAIKKSRATPVDCASGALGLHVVLGDDYPQRQENLRRGIAEGRLVYVSVLAEPV